MRAMTAIAPVISLICAAAPLSAHSDGLTAGSRTVERHGGVEIPGRIDPSTAAHAPEALDANRLVRDVVATLEAHYVFPENVDTLARALNTRLAEGRYDDAASPDELAQRLGRDLVELTADGHFSVNYRPDDGNALVYNLDEEDTALQSNFGFKSVEILPGNIGYLRLDHFANPQTAFETATGAMQFIENSAAVIIDLRYNKGGYNAMIQLLASYFFAADDDVMFYDYRYNEGGKTIARGEYVLPALPGRRTPDRPLYILTSSLSFSAAEWFAMSMSELGRATLVGDVTAGAAHPVTQKRVNDQFIMQVPIGRTRGPKSGSDFQETGVTPDIAAPAHQALSTAHRLALEEIFPAETSGERAWLLPFLALAKPWSEDRRRDAQDIAGDYGRMQVAIEDGVPIYRWRDRFSVALTPLGDGLFAADGDYGYRFRLHREGDKVIGVWREFQDGNSVYYARVD